MAERPLFSGCPFLRFVREFVHYEDEEGAAKVPYSALLPFVRYVRPLWRVYTAGLVCGLAVSLLTMALPLWPPSSSWTTSSSARTRACRGASSPGR